MTEAAQHSKTTQFVLMAVKHEATYWTRATLPGALLAAGLTDADSDDALIALRDEVLKALVGRSGERFWANDALTPARAASIRSACQVLHTLATEASAEVPREGVPDALADPDDEE